MNGLRHGRRRVFALAALAGSLVTIVVGGGIALAINVGTAGELNYRVIEAGTGGAGGPFSARALCPSSRHVTGGGYQEDETANLEIERSQPIDGRDGNSVPDDGWRVSGNAPSFSSFAVYAICDD
jgi:hypothetical protein